MVGKLFNLLKTSIVSWNSLFEINFSYSHLWTNVLLQLILGVLLEIIHHWKRIAIIYLASVLGGSLFITVLHNEVYTVGASSGVYGLLFSHLSTIIINWNEMDRKICRLFSLLLYIIFDISINFYFELVVKTDSNVSWTFRQKYLFPNRNHFIDKSCRSCRWCDYRIFGFDFGAEKF